MAKYFIKSIYFNSGRKIMAETAKKTQCIQCKVAVAGSGPAGMLAALKLAPLYEKVVLIGPESNGNDIRTTALMMPAIRVLQDLAIWPELQQHAAPLATMRIIDGTNHLIRSPAVSFHASETDEDAFGYNIPNIALNAALARAVADCAQIRRMTAAATAYHHDSQIIEITLANNSSVRTSLLVAADGRASAARDAAGIDTRQWHYPQTAAVLSFSHQLPHHNISTEFHTAEGSFTQIPLPGNLSSLVWVLSPERARQFLGLGCEAAGREIEKNMNSMLGHVKVETPIQTWPMGGIVPRVFAASRTILVGEAAHVFPPIGAQGLNLGIRDVVDLATTIAANIPDTGAESVIRSYNRYRRPDIWARTGFVHALNRALLSSFLPVQFARSAGLEMLRQFSPLRALFMREGMHSGSSLRCLLPCLPERLAKKTE